MKIRPPEKYLYFPTTFHSPFERAFEPSLIPIRACLRALVLFFFERAFEPWTIKGSAFPILPPFERAFEPSSCFFSSAPLSPRPSKVVHFLSYLHSSAPLSPCLISIRTRLRALVLSPFQARLRALDHQR